MKFGDLAIFAKVGWEILEIRLRYSYLAPVSILFRLQTGAFHEQESHFAIEFRGSTPPDARRATTDRLGSAQTRVSTGAPRAAALAAAPAAARSCAPACQPGTAVTGRRERPTSTAVQVGRRRRAQRGRVRRAAASERVSASCSVRARATSGAVGSAGFEKLPTEDVRAAAGRDCRLLQAAGIEPANV